MNALASFILCLITISSAHALAPSKSSRLSQYIKTTTTENKIENIIRNQGDSQYCLALKSPARLKKSLRQNTPARDLIDNLRKVGAPLAAHTIEANHIEFVWWTLALRDVNILTLSNSAHETSHTLEKILRICNGKYSYFFDGKIFSSSIHDEETPSVNVLSPKDNVGDLRFISDDRRVEYIRKATTRHDFRTLLGELVAYTIGAELEVSVMSAGDHQDLIPDGITFIDGNLSGMLDMQLILKSYLIETGERSPKSLEKIKSDTTVMCLMRDLLSTSESLIGFFRRHSRNSKLELLLPPEKIKPILGKSSPTEGTSEFFSTFLEKKALACSYFSYRGKL